MMGKCLGSFASDSSGQLDVLRHDGDSFGVDGAQVGVFKQTNQVCLGCFLQSHHGRRLETQVSLEVLCDLSHQSLEGQLSDQKFGGLLVTTDLTKSHSTGTVTMGFLTPPVAGADFLAALVANCFRGAFPPVDLRAVCLVRAIVRSLNVCFYYTEVRK